MKPKIKPFVSAGFLILAVLGFSGLPQLVYAASFWDGFGIALQKIILAYIDLYTIPAAYTLLIWQIITGLLPVVAGEIFRVALNLNNTIALTPASSLARSDDMVVVGWQFTRDLANMFFILILAWVGFATILRIKAYEIKTIIPKLVLIALLINFIPVICGVILDIASIVTKTFADKSTGIGLYIFKLLPAYKLIEGGTGSLQTLIPSGGGISGMAVASLMGIAFNLVAAFMLGLYAIIFIVRIVAIWILVVLAPLAWLGYIIPQGKKMWDMWWKQFIQWAIIGIPLTFFLYLSTFILSKTSLTGCKIDEAATFAQYGFLEGIFTGLIGEGLICKILPFLAGIIVMLVGFILSITLAPTGADKIMQGAKKGGIAASKVLGTQAWKGAKEYAKWPGQKLREYQYLRDRKKLSIGGALRGIASHDLKRAWTKSRPPLPSKSILGKTYLDYKTARGLGMSRHDALIEARKTWDQEWKKGTPTGSHTKAAAKGFKDAIKVGWKAGIGGKAKKTGTKICPGCKKTVAASAKMCTRPGCGYDFE